MTRVRVLKPFSLVGCGQVARGTEIDLTEPYNGGLVGIGWAEYVAEPGHVEPPAKQKRVEVVTITKSEEPPEPTPKREKEKEA